MTVRQLQQGHRIRDQQAPPARDIIQVETYRRASYGKQKNSLGNTGSLPR